MEHFDWEQFSSLDTKQKPNLDNDAIVQEKQIDVKADIEDFLGDNQSVCSNIQSVIPQGHLKLLGFYNQKNQNMYPEEKEVEKSNILSKLLQLSFCDIQEKFDVDSQLCQMYNNAVWIFHDKESNLYGFFPRKEIARLTNVIYNKKTIIKADEKYKFWFFPGESFYSAFELISAKKNNKKQRQGKVWTPRYNSKVSMEDREKGIRDEFDVLFSEDHTRLLDAPKNLETYIVPEGTKVICFDAFFGCNIMSIELPSTLECIGWNAFYHCSNLKEVKLPKGLRRLEGEAFVGCTSLSELHIPENVSFIGPNPIRECGYVNLTCDSPNYIVEDETLYNSDMTSIIAYWGKKTELFIQNSVEKVERSAFCFCESLRKVVFSKNTKEVSSNAFYYCQNLEEVIMSDSLTTLDQFVFCGCKNLSKITFSSNLTRIFCGTFCECTSLRNLILPNNIIEIWSDAFANCTTLQTIMLPQKLIQISDKAFQSCTSLRSITFPPNLRIISEKAFRYCRSLSEVWFMGDCPQIGDRAFLGCNIDFVHIKQESASYFKKYFPLGNIVPDV